MKSHLTLLAIIIFIILILVIGCKHGNQPAKVVLNETAQKNIAAENPATEQNQVLAKSEDRTDSEITSMEIGLEGGELNVTNPNSPIVGARLKILNNTLYDKTKISIIPITDFPEKEYCTIVKGILLNMGPVVGVTPEILHILLVIPFEHVWDDNVYNLVYIYNLTSKEWSEEPIAPLPSLPGLFFAPLRSISNDQAYFTTLCRYPTES